jgi:hypothetical protein
MDKLIYITVYKKEDEAIKAINKLNAQGFRPDQISVLAHNTDRFNTLFKSNTTKAALPKEVEHKVAAGEVPRAVEQALNHDPAVPVAVPGHPPVHHTSLTGGYVPQVGLTGLKLSKESILAHERGLKEGDILVILQTDQGQKYHPNMPLVNK